MFILFSFKFTYSNSVSVIGHHVPYHERPASVGSRPVHHSANRRQDLPDCLPSQRHQQAKPVHGEFICVIKFAFELKIQFLLPKSL